MGTTAHRAESPNGHAGDSGGALLATVARMYYLEGMGQSEIANIFGVSRSTVSRLLTTAREQGIVRITVEDHEPIDRELSRQLVERFGLHEAIVVRSIDGPISSVRRAIGWFAAPLVVPWLTSARHIGITGGRTLRQLIHFIQAPAPDSRQEIVQLMGMVGSAPSPIESSEICRSLAHRLHASFHSINAPLFLDTRESRDTLINHRHIRAVWDLFPSLDVALVGIGSLEDSVLADQGAIPPDEARRLPGLGCVGEIGGRFFDARGNEVASPLRDRVMSSDLATLQQTKLVVGVVHRPANPEGIRAAMTGRLVNALVTDDQTARAVLGLPVADLSPHMNAARACPAGAAR